MLKIRDLCIEFTDTVPSTRAVYDFNLEVKTDEIVGIVGESGSGKTMSALATMGLLNQYSKIPKGEILFEGKDLLSFTTKQWETLRGNEISMVFQEPMTSLNPVRKVGEQVEEALLLHDNYSVENRKARAIEMLKAVELPDPEEIYYKYPHQLSGGMRQRVMIAAALICKPKLLIADEPTTALDVTIQNEILQLLRKMNQEYHTAIIFITHNLGVVKMLCDKVVVMEKGKIIEQGNMQEVFEHPREAYTKKLLSAIPTRKNSMRKQQMKMTRTTM